MVSYDAKDNSLNSNNLIPGENLTKTFTVTITPTAKENTASYSIYLDLTNNTFVKCDDSNYNSITNACVKDYEELTYTFKNQEGEVLSSDNLIGATGRILLASETKTVEVETTYEYTMEIEFHETNADQNHNMGKIIEGNINVEFGMMGSEYILSHYDTVLTRNDFSTTVTNTTTGTIYKSLDESQYDNDGEVYYFAGNPTDNWVYFGGYYWRIIRINGNGTIRLIYSGANTLITGTENHINSTYYLFNNVHDNNAYVGFMYTIGQVHGVNTSSNAKSTLDIWYNTNLNNYTKYLDGNTGFCGDRTPSTSSSNINNTGGTGNTTTYYGTYIRLNTNKNPSLKCDNSDLYTITESKQGNASLTNPIGLITADEISMAGGVIGKSNNKYYLYTGRYYWTMSPYYSYASNAYSYVSVIRDDGCLDSNIVSFSASGIKPVINLKSEVSLTGSGTVDDPYEIN